MDPFVTDDLFGGVFSALLIFGKLDVGIIYHNNNFLVAFIFGNIFCCWVSQYQCTRHLFLCYVRKTILLLLLKTTLNYISKNDYYLMN